MVNFWWGHPKLGLNILLGKEISPEAQPRKHAHILPYLTKKASHHSPDLLNSTYSYTKSESCNKLIIIIIWALQTFDRMTESQNVVCYRQTHI